MYFFLGFKSSVKGYIVIDIKIREIFIFRDVSFHEETFIHLCNNNTKQSYGNSQEISFNLQSFPAYECVNENTQLEEHVGNIQEDGNLRRSTTTRKAPI